MNATRIALTALLATAAILVLAIIGGALYVASIDPTRFRAEIVALAADQGGIRLDLGGDIGWRFWPAIGLSVADVQADWLGAEAGSRPPLVALESLHVDVRVVPLLSFDPRLEVDGIALRGARIHLERDATGRANWQPAEPSPADDTEAPTALAPRAIALSTLRIDDALVSFFDAATDARIELAEFSLRLDGIAPGERFPLSARFALLTDGARRAEVAIDGDGAIDDAIERIAFDALTIRVDLVRDAAPPVPIELAAALRYELEAGVLALDAGRITAAGLEATFRLEGTPGDAATTWRGTLTVPSQDTAPLAALGVNLDLPPQAGLDVDFEGNAQAVRLGRLALTAHDATLAGDATIRIEPRRRVDFALEAKSIQLASWLATGETGADGAVAAPPRPADLDAPLLPQALIDDTDWDGIVRIGTLANGGNAAESVALSTRNDRGRIGIDLAIGKLLGGVVDLRAAIAPGDRDRTALHWQVTGSARGIDADAIPGAFRRRIEMTARLDLDLALSARGNSRRALADSLTGRITLDGGQGRVDVSGLKREAGSIAALAQSMRLGGETLVRWPDVIDYRRLTGDMQLDGLGKQTIAVALDNLAIDARGGYDLAANTIDHAVELTVHDDPELPTFAVASYLMDVPIPMRCKGPLDGAGQLCAIESKGVERVLAAALRNEAGDRLRDELADKAPEELRDAAKGVFDLLRGRRRD